MRLLGRKRLSHLQSRGNEVEKWVRSWATEILAANWKHPSDVRDQFPNARHNGNGHFVFPVVNCNYVICLFIAFPQGVALITELKLEDETHGN